MLEQFQQAFADLVASPEFVSEVCEDPGLLRDRYELSDREWRRLVSIVNQPGMKCNCMLYKANRLTPMAEFVPALCKVLGKDLNPLLGEYWVLFAHTNINFLVESYRFCQFVQEKIDGGSLDADTVLPVLKSERAGLAKQMKEMFCPNDAGTGQPDLNDIATLFTVAGMEVDLNIFLSYSN